MLLSLFYEYLDQIASLYYSESQSSTSTFNKLTDINPMLTLYMNTLNKTLYLMP